MRLVIGADDYGLSPTVSAGILELAQARRLTATSCMTLFPEWPEQGAQLQQISNHVDLGLHFTLTDHAPTGTMPGLAPKGRLPGFRDLLISAYRGHLDLAEVSDELHRQLDRFESVVGRPPDFVDGHQHIQQLPGVCTVLVDVCAQRLPRPYVRTCAEQATTVLSRPHAARAALLSFAARPLLRALATQPQIAHNNGLTGVYDFAPRSPYGQLVPRFLQGVRDGTYMMCHPGRADAVLARRDSVTVQRSREMDALSSDGFGALLEEAQITLARPSDFTRETPSSA